MGRLLFWILLGVAAYLALRWWLRQQSSARRAAPRPAPGRDEDMLACHVCGLNVPRSEALLASGRVYCSEDHRRRDTPAG